MKLKVRELLDLGYWDDYCALTGCSVWACNEGQISSSDEVDIPEKLVRKMLGVKEPETLTSDLLESHKTPTNSGDYVDG